MTIRGIALRRPRLAARSLADDAAPPDPPRTTAAPALAVIKGVHTLIFFAELASIGWLVISGVIGRRDRSVGVAAMMVAAVPSRSRRPGSTLADGGDHVNV